MQTLTIGRSQYTLNPTRDVGALQDKFSKCTGKPKKPSIARARRDYPVFEAGMSTAAYVSLFEDMNGKHLTPSKAYFAPLNKDACTLYSGADVHELIDDLSDDAGDPVPVIPAPVQAIPAPAAPVAVPMLSRMVDDGASADAMARAVFSRTAQQTPIQYLPLWARISIERLDADSELRTSSGLSDLLDAYACTYGQTCDDDTRASALHICARRFPGFDAAPVSTVRHVSPEEFDAMAAALQARAAPEAAACEAIRAPGTLAAKLARADVARAQAPRTREFESPLPVNSKPETKRVALGAAVEFKALRLGELFRFDAEGQIWMRTRGGYRAGLGSQLHAFYPRAQVIRFTDYDPKPAPVAAPASPATLPRAPGSEENQRASRESGYRMQREPLAKPLPPTRESEPVTDAFGAMPNDPQSPKPTFGRYRYAPQTGQTVVAFCPSVDGYKTRASRLAEYCKFRYVGRAGGYVGTEKKADYLRELFAAGFDASAYLHKLIPPSQTDSAHPLHGQCDYVPVVPQGPKPTEPSPAEMNQSWLDLAAEMRERGEEGRALRIEALIQPLPGEPESDDTIPAPLDGLAVAEMTGAEAMADLARAGSPPTRETTNLNVKREHPELSNVFEYWRGKCDSLSEYQAHILECLEDVHAGIRAQGKYPYNSDAWPRIAALMALRHGYPDASVEATEGGWFGTHCYMAGQTIRRREETKRECDDAALFKVGQIFPRLIFNDAKQVTGAHLLEMSDSGYHCKLSGKRGRSVVTITCTASALQAAIDRARVRVQVLADQRARSKPAAVAPPPGDSQSVLAPPPVHSAPGQSDPIHDRPMPAQAAQTGFEGLSDPDLRAYIEGCHRDQQFGIDFWRAARELNDRKDSGAWTNPPTTKAARVMAHPLPGELNAAPATPIRALRGAEPHQHAKPHPSSRTHATARADPPATHSRRPPGVADSRPGLSPIPELAGRSSRKNSRSVRALLRAATMNLTELHPALHAAARVAHAVASRQSRPAYVVLGLRAQVCASFPGVWCMRVHPSGAIDPMCITA